MKGESNSKRYKLKSDCWRQPRVSKLNWMIFTNVFWRNMDSIIWLKSENFLPKSAFPSDPGEYLAQRTSNILFSVDAFLVFAWRSVRNRTRKAQQAAATFQLLIAGPTTLNNLCCHAFVEPLVWSVILLPPPGTSENPIFNPRHGHR